MDPKKTNPCEYEPFVKIVSWAETDCWCCSSVRSAVVFAPAAFALGLVAAGKIATGIIVGLLGAAVSIALLRLAREFWDDGSEEGQGK